MPSAARILLVDTSAERAYALQQLLGAAGYETVYSESAEDAVAVLERAGADVLVVKASDVADVAPLFDAADDAAIIVQVDRDGDADWSPTKWGGRDVVACDAGAEEILAVVERAAHEMGIRRE